MQFSDSVSSSILKACWAPFLAPHEMEHGGTCLEFQHLESRRSNKFKIIFNYIANLSHPRLHKTLSQRGKKKKNTKSVVRIYLLNWKLWGGAWQLAETNPLGNPDAQQIRELMSFP